VGKPDACSGRLIPHVRIALRSLPSALLCALALVVSPAATLAAAPQQPDSVAGLSVDRIKGKLAKPPAPELKLEAPVPLRTPTFRSRVDQRVFVLTLEEALHKEFDLNDLQRQSADWASKCCGYNIAQLVDLTNEALRARKVRKTQEQIWHELAELEAARKKIPPAEVK
jgi:hypothetical protein